MLQAVFEGSWSLLSTDHSQSFIIAAVSVAVSLRCSNYVGGIMHVFLVIGGGGCSSDSGMTSRATSQLKMSMSTTLVREHIWK